MESAAANAALLPGRAPSYMNSNKRYSVVKSHALAANFDYSLHVASLSSDQPPSYLELLVIVDLNVESAGVLDVFVLVGILGLCLRLLANIVRFVSLLISLLLLLLLLLLLGENVLVGKLSHVLLAWLLTDLLLTADLAALHSDRSVLVAVGLGRGVEDGSLLQYVLLVG